MPWLPSRQTNTLEIERRDPTAATKSVSWYSPTHAMVPSWDAERAFQIAYLGNAIVFRCVQIIANDIASLPLRVGPDPDKPQTFRANHPFARKLSKPPGGPNPKHAAQTLIKHAVASLIVAGRFGWELEPTNDGLYNIWPLVTNNLRPLPTEGGSEYFREFWYQVTGVEQKKVLQLPQIHYQWFPSQLDFRQPESIIEAANLDISVAIMQDRYDYAFLNNDARPAAVIVHERMSDKATQDEWRAQLLAEHQGPDNAGKVAFTAYDANAGVDAKSILHVETLGIDSEKAQMVERYKIKIRNICAALGVPLSKLDASGRTFDNAAAEEKTYWQDTIRPLADYIAGNFSIDLLPRFPNSNSFACWFDYTGIEALRHKVTPVSQPVSADVLYKSQLWTKNEARADYGLPPVPDGDEFYDPETDPTNLLSAITSGISGNGKGTDSDSNSDEDDDKRTIRRLILQKLILNGGMVSNAQISNGHTVSDSDISDEEIAEVRKLRVIRETETVTKVLEKKFQRSFKRLFEKQKSIVIQRLDSRRGKMFIEPKKYNVEVRQIIGTVFDYDYWLRITTDLAFSLHEDIVTASAIRIGIKTDVPFDINEDYIQRFIIDNANRLASQITNTTYKQVQEQLVVGSSNNESLEQLTNRMKHVFGIAIETRTRTIARTEVTSTFNGAAQLLVENESASTNN